MDQSHLCARTKRKDIIRLFPQKERVSKQYRMEGNILEFTERLLRKIGAWNKNINLFLNSTAFATQTRSHATDAKNRITQHYNRHLEDVIFNIYKHDYDVFGFDRTYISK
jgi:hypothetical protein